MILLKTPQEMKAWQKSVTGTVGFVPTMGALHLGHEELLRKSRAENEFSVLSIFVNPTQFNDPKDFKKYPITWESDLEAAQRNKVDVVFSPTKDVMYPDDYKYQLSENDFSLMLDGAARPRHFDGVLSIVMKLFQIVEPTKAYFGEKDYQQLQLIKGMAEAFFLNVQIVPVPTVREESGLALSSRNLRLSSEDRKTLAPLIYQRIRESASAEQAHEKLLADGFKIDYVEDRYGRRFVAVHLKDVRLIDNVAI